MTATHCVKDSDGGTAGFVIDGVFYADAKVRDNIQYIDNLFLGDAGQLVAEGKLQETTYRQAVNEAEYKRLVKENGFVRDIQTELEEWKRDECRKALQLEGSRQIGKTTELLKFAYRNYEYTVYVSLSDDKYGFEEVLRGGCTPLDMEKYCQKAQLTHFVNDRQTLLIIDEIQISPLVYNSIRTICSRLDCDVIVTGSYLGQTLQKEYFQPAGTLTYRYMYPMSFREFCRALGKEEILDQLDLYGKSDGTAYEDLWECYELFRQIGGYPEAVKAYVRTHNIGKCHEVMDNLLTTFEKESRNYFKESRETLIFKTVYTEAIKEMCREKRGNGSRLVETVTDIAKGSQKQMISREEVSNAVAWLVYSGIVGECGLYRNGDVNDYVPARRLYYMDCGIASYVAGQTALPKGSVDGFLTENFVYTELYRLYKQQEGRKPVKGDMPCFSCYNGYELDFMVLGKDNTVYGLEVKTDTGIPKSLRVYIDRKLVDKGIVAKRTNGGRGDLFDTIPVYMAGAGFPYRS